MWRRHFSALLVLLPLLFGFAQQAEAQQTYLIRRSQLLGFVIGQGIGQALSDAMDAYASGKAARQELDELRREIAKCGDNCSADLKTKLHKHETAQATAEEVIDDAARLNNMSMAWANGVKAFLSIEPQKLTADQKAWQDMNTMLYIIGLYCYTISDQKPGKQAQCERDTPYQIAQEFDILLNNMCREKAGKEAGLDLNDDSSRRSGDRELAHKFNNALGAASECFRETSYYYAWIDAIYKSCGWGQNRRGLDFGMKPSDIAFWCIPDPTDNAHNEKVISSREVEFDWSWLRPVMWRMDVKPKVLECMYGDGTDKAKFYFWPKEPPEIRLQNGWGGVIPKRVSDEGRRGQKYAYELLGDGHYLGLHAVSKCPEDLEKAILLRRNLLDEITPGYVPQRVKAQGGRPAPQPIMQGP